MASVTVIDGSRVTEVDAEVAAGRLVLRADDLGAVGFERKPEGLCRDDICVPVREGSGLEVDGGIDVSRLTEMLDWPLVVDAEQSVACLGTPAAARRADLTSLVAPDFELPDLEGRPHRLSEHRGKKVILIAYASW